ncbi:hypothetical protein V8C43DRAFT_16331 [Trichoderma afarasin]
MRRSLKMGTHNRLAGEAELVITWRMITIGFCAISFLWWLGDAWRSGNDLGYVNSLPCAIRLNIHLSPSAAVMSAPIPERKCR